MNITRIRGDYLLPAQYNTHPSIAYYQGKRLMTYRHEPPPWEKHTRVAMCECDEDWQPLAGTSRVLAIPTVQIKGGDQVVEDCRLFHTGNGLSFSVSNREGMGTGCFHPAFDAPPFFQWLNVPEPQPMEKNWQFFCYNRTVYGVRWISGHQIYEISPSMTEAMKVHEDTRPWQWDWGIIHGGTCPIPYGDLFISMFHSHTIGFPPEDGKAVAREKQSGEERKVYFAAPYAFENKPPFRVALVPKHPMIWPALQTPEYRTPHRDYVVFPCGLVRTGDDWICTYGDDLACYKAEFTSEELFSVLRPL